MYSTGTEFWQSNNDSIRSQCPLSLRYGSLAPRLQGFRIRILPEVWMSVSCECGVLSARGLCVWLVTRPGKSYRMSCVSDREASIMRRFWPTSGCCAIKIRSDCPKLLSFNGMWSFRTVCSGACCWCSTFPPHPFSKHCFCQPTLRCKTSEFCAVT